MSSCSRSSNCAPANRNSSANCHTLCLFANEFSTMNWRRIAYVFQQSIEVKRVIIFWASAAGCRGKMSSTPCFDLYLYQNRNCVVTHLKTQTSLVLAPRNSSHRLVWEYPWTIDALNENNRDSVCIGNFVFRCPAIFPRSCRCIADFMHTFQSTRRQRVYLHCYFRFPIEHLATPTEQWLCYSHNRHIIFYTWTTDHILTIHVHICLVQELLHNLAKCFSEYVLIFIV